MSEHLQTLAERGARIRLAELAEEQRAIVALFPSLGRTPRDKATETASRPTRRRRRMTAEQRAAVSKRMKAYWAGRRKAAK